MSTSPDIVSDASDVLIVGAGLAGLFTALKLAPMPCTVLSPVALGEGASSAWAQGGIAAALGEGDSPESHAADTIRAGAGTVDAAVAHLVASEAGDRIADLLAYGAPFDRDAAGRPVQSREAAHSAARVVRVSGDRAGAAIMAALVAAARQTPSITVIEGLVADEIAIAAGRAAGVLAHRAGDRSGRPIWLRARHTVLATGGVGGLYAVTTNPPGVGGAGLGMAARAGAAIGDAEFVQFHPTGLAVDRDPTPLASEALRGDGAVLVDGRGARFMRDEHPDAELAPRDVVARAIHRRIMAGEPVFLDTRAALGDRITAHFPTIAAHCAAAGIDPVRQPIPVRPVQHYHMGGVRADRDGATTLEGLRVCGEVACTGLHGANRLASNSLLEAVVFGARIADALSGQARTAPPGRLDRAPQAPGTVQPGTVQPGTAPPGTALDRLRRTMTDLVGVERCATGLRRALASIAAVERAAARDGQALANMTAAATLIAAAALLREESRGGHYRTDFPATRPVARPSTLTLAEAVAVRDAAAGDPPP